MKYNFGSNNKVMEGYVNVDGLELPNVDVVHNLIDLPYSFAKDNEADEIVSIECLEHISFKHTEKVLKEWCRILKPGGLLRIQVPDCGKAMEYYMRNQICDCVPHKDTGKGYPSDPKCFRCQGSAKIHPNRWLYSFTGAQKHKFDAHLNIFTQERMKEVLSKAGFQEIKFEDDLYKIKVTATKYGENKKL